VDEEEAMRLAMKASQGQIPPPPQKPPQYVVIAIFEGLSREEALWVAMEASRVYPDLFSCSSNGISAAFMGAQLAMGAAGTVFLGPPSFSDAGQPCADAGTQLSVGLSEIVDLTQDDDDDP
jgi:hypothetical protein